MKHIGGMINFTFNRTGNRLVDITIDYWDDKISMCLKKGTETERLERDLEALLNQVKAMNNKSFESTQEDE